MIPTERREDGEKNNDLLKLQTALNLIDYKKEIAGALEVFKNLRNIDTLKRMLYAQRTAFDSFKKANPGERTFSVVPFPIAQLLGRIYDDFKIAEKPVDDPMFAAFVEAIEKLAGINEQELKKLESGDGRNGVINVEIEQTRAQTAEIQGKSDNAQIIGVVDNMTAQELERYILNFKKGEITDGMAIVLMEKIRNLKIKGVEKLKLMDDVDRRLED